MLNNGHLFPFWMVRTWLASKPAAAVTIANRKQIWYLSKNWHIQTCIDANTFTLLQLQLFHSQWNSVNARHKSMKYVKSNHFWTSHSQCQHKSYNAMYKDYQTLCIELYLYIPLSNPVVVWRKKVTLQISTLTGRLRFHSLGGSFLKSERWKWVNNFNIPALFREAT